MAIGPALVATKRYSHPDIGRAYARAWELCRQLGDYSREFTALRGLQLHHASLLEMEKAQHFAEEAMRVAERLDDAARLVGSHVGLGLTLFWQGRLEPALAHFRRGFEMFTVLGLAGFPPRRAMPVLPDADLLDARLPGSVPR
jgi:tetratricopeptide (TPR) repeat protein